MPRFFLHLRDDLDVPDLEGSELLDLDAAQAKAIAEARVLMCDLLKNEGRLALHHSIDIEDEQGAVLASVPFRDAVKIEG